MIYIDRPTGPLVLEPPKPRLDRCKNPADVWLHCDWCHRFFQYRSMAGEHCPFDDCFHGTLVCGIFFWDDLREADDDRWPSDTRQLSHGMPAPDMESHYAAKRVGRIDALLAAFAQSSHASALDGPPAYLRAFLEMMSDLCWDLTVAGQAGFLDESALDIVDQLPVWSQTRDPAQAPRMLEELVALFRFAHQTSAVQDADKWLEVLGDEQKLISMFARTMEVDPRLQPAAPCRARRRLKPDPAPPQRRDGRRKNKRAARAKRKRR